MKESKKEMAIDLFYRGLTLKEVKEWTGLKEGTLRMYRSLANQKAVVHKQPMCGEWVVRFRDEWIEAVNRIRVYAGKERMKSGPDGGEN